MFSGEEFADESEKQTPVRVFPSDVIGSDISLSIIRANLESTKSKRPGAEQRVIHGEHLNFDEMEEYRLNTHNRSRNKSNNVTLKRSFEEDVNQKTQINGRRVTDSRPISILPQQPYFSSRNVDFQQAKTARRKESDRHHNSNGESDSVSEEQTEHLNSKILDDTFLEQRAVTRTKTEYFNILIIGQANLGKFDFIKFCFKNVFEKNLVLNKENGDVNEFVHEYQTGSGNRKVVSLMHIHGHSKDFQIQDWYKSTKEYILDKMRTYNEVRKLFSNDKRLQKETPVDSRVHLCLHFIQAPKPRLTEIIYMKKLQKLVPILPVMVMKEEIGFDLEYVRSLKASVLKELQDCEIDIPDLQESDFGVRQFRNGLLGRSAPFFIYPVRSEMNSETDLGSLVRLMTHSVATYFRYKAEVLFSANAEKAMQKPNFKKKKREEKKEHDNAVGVGVGVAIGLGLFGALVAFKNKIF